MDKIEKALKKADDGQIDELTDEDIEALCDWVEKEIEKLNEEVPKK